MFQRNSFNCENSRLVPREQSSSAHTLACDGLRRYRHTRSSSLGGRRHQTPSRPNPRARNILAHSLPSTTLATSPSRKLRIYIRLNRRLEADQRRSDEATSHRPLLPGTFRLSRFPFPPVRPHPSERSIQRWRQNHHRGLPLLRSISRSSKATLVRSETCFHNLSLQTSSITTSTLTLNTLRRAHQRALYLQARTLQTSSQSSPCLEPLSVRLPRMERTRLERRRKGRNRTMDEESTRTHRVLNIRTARVDL